MKKRLLSVLNFTIFFLIGLFLLWLVFRKLDIRAVVLQIFDANYWWVLLSFVFAIISHFARALRWNILINSMGYKTKAITTFYAVMVGYLANMAIPRLGEVSRCGMLNKKDKIPINSLLGSVLAERMFDFIVLIILIFIVIIMQLELVGGFVNRLIFEPLFSNFSNNANAILYFLGILVTIIILSFVIHQKYKLQLQKFAFYQKLKSFFSGFMDGMNTILKLKKRSLFLFYTFIIWFMYFLMTFIIFFTMEATSGLHIIDGVTILAIGSLGMVVPVPGGIGAYHFIVKALLFELYHVPNEIAASWATLIHTSQSFMMLVVGAFSYFMIISLKKKENNEQTETA